MILNYLIKRILTHYIIYYILLSKSLMAENVVVDYELLKQFEMEGLIYEQQSLQRESLVGQ